ncbi:MAG: hypothetical protein JWL87_370 [Candidatus Adlerbacteria bacterium]|nr:hypothetical protein [Candidatus Adlerbacteria bacterium]
MITIREVDRLESFSDAVFAIVITIAVLALRVPQQATLESLRDILPIFLVYIFSFQTIGTYWNNHHHLLQASKRISTKIMWANLHLLFWISLIPFTMEWLGKNIGAIWSTAAFAFVLLMCGVAYRILVFTIVFHHGQDSELAHAIGNDAKGWISIGAYVLALILAFVAPWASYVVVVLVALMWFIPDKRLQGQLKN